MAFQEHATPETPLAPTAAEKEVATPKQRLTTLISGSFGTHRGLVRMLLGETEYLAGRINQFLQPDLTATQRLVFVCLGNINRSAFAEGMATEIKRLIRIVLEPGKISDPFFKPAPGRELQRFWNDFFRTGVGYYVWSTDDPAPFWADLTNMLLRRT